jgi:hypothetical protein
MFFSLVIPCLIAGTREGVLHDFYVKIDQISGRLCEGTNKYGKKGGIIEHESTAWITRWYFFTNNQFREVSQNGPPALDNQESYYGEEKSRRNILTRRVLSHKRKRQ